MLEQKHYKSMLLDGKNNVYRSIFAGHGDEGFKKTGNDYFVIFMRFINHYVSRFHPESVHIFWDAPVKEVWRRKVYPEYKSQRSELLQKYDFDVRAELKRQMILAMEALRVLNVRQYYRAGQEADDLIYSFVIANPDSQHLIVSGDGDFKQIIYRHDNVDLYNPLNGRRLVQKPDIDPVLFKCFVGDNSDNITGYDQIGPVRARPLVMDPDMRTKFFASEKARIVKEDKRVVVGDAVFNTNKQLIDLSLCPDKEANVEYIKTQQVKPVEFSATKLTELGIRKQIKGLYSEIPTLIPAFKKLI